MTVSLEHNWFYVPSGNISKNYIVFPEETAHHASHVLRKKKHKIISVTDGQGKLYTARIVVVQPSTIKAEILEKEIMPALKPPYIDLAFVPLKGNRSEIMIEKGKELGVRRFLLFISQNGVIKQLKQAKIERFRHVMISAMVQSQQCMISPILPVDDIRSLMENFNDYDRILVADPSGIKQVPPGNDSVLLVIGPEGGFERDEILLFKQAGVELFSLGRRRLRSETAAIAGIVKILAANHIL